MCVFKYHAFIYFLRPPPWYGTILTVKKLQWFLHFVINNFFLVILFANFLSDLKIWHKIFRFVGFCSTINWFWHFNPFFWNFEAKYAENTLKKWNSFSQHIRNKLFNHRGSVFIKFLKIAASKSTRPLLRFQLYVIGTGTTDSYLSCTCSIFFTHLWHSFHIWYVFFSFICLFNFSPYFYTSIIVMTHKVQCTARCIATILVAMCVLVHNSVGPFKENDARDWVKKFPVCLQFFILRNVKRLLWGKRTKITWILPIAYGKCS